MVALFNDVEAETNFYNLLAARKLKKLRAERAEYEAEMTDALAKCGDILLNHGAEFNYVAELMAVEDQIKGMGDNDGFSA